MKRRPRAAAYFGAEAEFFVSTTSVSTRNEHECYYHVDSIEGDGTAAAGNCREPRNRSATRKSTFLSPPSILLQDLHEMNADALEFGGGRIAAPHEIALEDNVRST